MGKRRIRVRIIEYGKSEPPPETDIDLVRMQTGCPREKAVRLLHTTKGDVVDAINKFYSPQKPKNPYVHFYSF